LVDLFSKFLHPDNILVKELLANHTSFRVGGPAEVFVTPQNADEVAQICTVCRAGDIPLTVLGDGTNVLVSDAGLRGVVLCTAKMDKITVQECGLITAQAGAKLAKVAQEAYKAGLAGFEFASGIPGTVGGAVYMNAGAYDGTVGEFCASVTMLQRCAIVATPGSEMDFGYRQSAAQKNGGFILEAAFQLHPGNQEDILAKMRDLNNRRRQSQPLDVPSAGSTFKRPPGHFAGKLIQDSGLKGFAIGGAQVSEKHAGFVINTGGATAQNIFDLIQEVQRQVYEKFNVKLEPEVRLLGFEVSPCEL